MIDRRERVFVTGASSTVGSLLVPKLRGAGVPIVLLGRKPDSVALSDSWQFLDLENTADTLPSIEGCALIHTANLWLVPEWIEKFYGKGVRRVIGFSSTSRFTKLASASPYEMMVVNKLIKAEQQIEDECSRLGISWTIFRPTLIYGGIAGDRNVADIARFIRKFGFFPLIGPAQGRRQPVSAGDLADACMRALEAPSSFNKAYNLSGGEDLPYIGMVRRIFETLGRPPIFIRIPISLFRAAVHVARLHPKYAHLTLDMALRMQTDLVFDHSDAASDFGFSPGRFDPTYLKKLL